MGKTFRIYLYGRRVYGCNKCRNHLTLVECLISKNFTGQHGKAFLFDLVVNVKLGEPQERDMTTGLHVVRDVNCEKCGQCMGWKYDMAYNPQQKYKEGKFILEKNLLTDVS